MASLWSLELEAIASLLQLLLSLITFMVVPFITSVYGQILLHLWLVHLLHL